MSLTAIRAQSSQKWEYTSNYDEELRSFGVIKGKSKYVGQGQIFKRNPSDPQQIWSEGFSFCSGLFLQEGSSWIFSHLEPSSHDFFDFLERQPHASRKGIFVYGTLSHEQYELTRLLLKGRWGNCSLKQIKLDTGKTHWWLLGDFKTGLISIRRKKPSHDIFHYKALK